MVFIRYYKRPSTWPDFLSVFDLDKKRRGGLDKVI